MISASDTDSNKVTAASFSNTSIPSLIRNVDPAGLGPSLSIPTATYVGYIEDLTDALYIFEATQSGILPRTTRRLNSFEKERAVYHGAIHVFLERESGIKRWTDKLHWSASRITGHFLMYREIIPISVPDTCTALSPTCDSESYLHTDTASDHHTNMISIIHPTPPASSLDDDMDSGSNAGGKPTCSMARKSGFRIKSSGLVKRTVSLEYRGIIHHLVSYFDENLIHNLPRPRLDPLIQSLNICPEIRPFIKKNAHASNKQNSKTELCSGSSTSLPLPSLSPHNVSNGSFSSFPSSATTRSCSPIIQPASTPLATLSKKRSSNAEELAFGACAQSVSKIPQNLTLANVLTTKTGICNGSAAEQLNAMVTYPDYLLKPHSARESKRARNLSVPSSKTQSPSISPLLSHSHSQLTPPTTSFSFPSKSLTCSPLAFSSGSSLINNFGTADNSCMVEWVSNLRETNSPRPTSVLHNKSIAPESMDIGSSTANTSTPLILDHHLYLNSFLQSEDLTADLSLLHWNLGSPIIKQGNQYSLWNANGPALSAFQPASNANQVNLSQDVLPAQFNKMDNTSPESATSVPAPPHIISGPFATTILPVAAPHNQPPLATPSINYSNHTATNSVNTPLISGSSVYANWGTSNLPSTCAPSVLSPGFKKTSPLDSKLGTCTPDSRGTPIMLPSQFSLPSPIHLSNSDSSTAASNFPISSPYMPNLLDSANTLPSWLWQNPTNTPGLQQSNQSHAKNCAIPALVLTLPLLDDDSFIDVSNWLVTVPAGYTADCYKEGYFLSKNV